MRKIFISYAREDADVAERLYQDIRSLGATPWIDVHDIIAGQRWASVIREAIRESSHFILLLSSKSLTKRGFVQKEVNQALEVLSEIPPDETYIIPVRLDDCTPHHEQLREIQWVDLFPSYVIGLEKIKRALEDSRAITHKPKKGDVQIGGQNNSGNLQPDQIFDDKTNLKPQKLANQSLSLFNTLKNEIEKLQISREIQKSLQTVLLHSKYPEWMSIGGRLVENPVWLNYNRKSLRKIINDYRLDNESAPLIKHLDLLLTKGNDEDGHSYLFTYYSSDWGTYFIPFRKRNNENLTKRLQLNAKHLAIRRRVAAETIKITPLDGQYLISVKQNPLDRNLIIFIFEFCSVNYTKIPKIEKIPEIEFGIKEDEDKIRAWVSLNSLRSEKVRPINGDVIKAIHEYYGIHLDNLPLSVPDGILPFGVPYYRNSLPDKPEKS